MAVAIGAQSGTTLTHAHSTSMAWQVSGQIRRVMPRPLSSPSRRCCCPLKAAGRFVVSNYRSASAAEPNP